MTANDTSHIELALTAMAHGGSALGRHEGRVIFVPYAIPGETVRAEIVESRTRWARARLVKVLDPSPHRIQPPCPYFGPDQCGGCHLQHMAYETQAELKQSVIVDQLQRLGRIEDAESYVQDIIGAAEPWRYRNHVQFGVTSQGQLGFMAPDSHRIVPVKECLLLDPLLAELRTALDMEWPQLVRLSLRCGSATGDRMAIYELAEYADFDIEVDFAVSCVLMLADGEPVVMMGNPYLTEYVAGQDFRVSAGSFFQVNTGGAEALVDVVGQFLSPTPDDTLLDLYCGVGLFGLALAGQVGEVIGVEADPTAGADFVHNAQAHDHATFIEGDVLAAIRDLDTDVDLVVLDPPRRGAGKEVIAQLLRLSPQRIVYVSCDPATLARDTRRLIDGGYHLKAIQPVDLFPQTYHVESVALFCQGAIS